MMQRVQELCRKLKPVLGVKVDRLWAVYLAESDPAGKADIEQALELLAAKHLNQSFQPDRAPFPPPPRAFAGSGDVHVGAISYADRPLYPFYLRSDRLKEHILVAGRSGSGKTNLTFVLMLGIMARGIKVLALDWKRGYRDLLSLQPDLLVYTIGREVSPFRFNPLIPPPGCEPNVWIKLIVDVIASAYLGGEGVISLLVAGLDKLYRDCQRAMGSGHWVPRRFAGTQCSNGEQACRASVESPTEASIQVPLLSARVALRRCDSACRAVPPMWIEHSAQRAPSREMTCRRSSVAGFGVDPSPDHMRGPQPLDHSRTQPARAQFLTGHPDTPGHSPCGHSPQATDRR